MNSIKPKIPNFTIVEQCGRGGSSTVWLAIDSDGIRRAIRIMDSVDPENKERIEAEGNAISMYRNVANQHPNLLDILYFGRTSKYLYYVTELADNIASFECKYRPDTLSNRIRTRRYSKSEALDYIEAILNGVEYLHKRHLAHHDLKPENILFIRNELKIADPGLSSSIVEASHAGTDGFYPPWQATGEEADIYAIGKIIYCLYTRLNADQFPEIPEGLNIDKIADLNDIALRCCDGDDEFRYKNIAEIRADVLKIRRLPPWKEYLIQSKGYAAPVFGIFLLISLFFNFRPYLNSLFSYIPEKEGRRIYLHLQENFSHANMFETFEALKKLNRHCPGLAKSEDFRNFYTQLKDNIEWLNCYRTSENTVLTLPIVLNLALYPTAGERETVVQRYILMNPATTKMPSMMGHYYRFTKKTGDQEKAKKVLNSIKNIRIGNHNRLTVALAFLQLSNDLVLEANYKDALYFAERAQQLAPQLFAVYIMTFQSHYFLDDYDKALVALRKLYKLQPDSICIERFYSLLIQKGLDFSL